MSSIELASRQNSTRSLLDVFPVEIFEHIARCIATEDSEATVHSRRLADTPRKLLPPWRADCAAFRSTCRLFWQTSAPTEALFNTVPAYTTRKSLQTLEEIASRPHLAHLVKRVAFIKPCLSESTKVFDLLYRSRGDGDPDTEAPEAQMAKARALYSKLLKEQRELFVFVYGTSSWKGSGPQSWAKALKRFPNLQALFISDCDYYELDGPVLQRGSHLARNYPDLLLSPFASHNMQRDWWMNEYMSSVLQAIARSRVSVPELAWDSKSRCDWGIESIWDWDENLELRGSQFFSNLRQLDLTLLSVEDYNFYGRNNWSGNLLPVLGRTQLLEDLRIHAWGIDPGNEAHTGYTVFWTSEIYLPNLRALYLRGSIFSRGDFCKFLNRHSAIRELHLTQVRIEADSDETEEFPWRDTFDILRKQVIDSGMPKTYHLEQLEPCSKVVSMTGREASTLMLYDYLNDKGSWTEELSALWMSP